MRGRVFAPAPQGVVEAYALDGGGPWAVATIVALACGGLWTQATTVREVLRARRQRRRRHAELRLRAPLLPGEEPDGDRLVVVEGERPDAWWLPGPAPRLVITTAALRRLEGRQVDAVVADEQGHARARHHWLLHCSAALAGGFPRVSGVRRVPRRFGPSPGPEDHVPQRVSRLLAPPERLTPTHRLRLTAYAALVPVVPVLVAFFPGLRALGRS